MPKPVITVDKVRVVWKYDPHPMDEAHCRFQEWAKDEFALMGCYVEAVVSYPMDFEGNRRIDRLQSGGLWGIADDEGVDYLRSIEKEELADLFEHLDVFNVKLPRLAAVDLGTQAGVSREVKVQG